MDQTPASVPPASEPGGVEALQPIPVVGRDGELATLRQIFDRIQADGQVVASVGEPGIGKTRLAEEFLDRLNGSEVRAIRAHCFEGETTLAYGLFVEALRSAAAQPELAQRLTDVPDRWLTEASRLRPELISGRANLPPAPPPDHPGVQI